MDEGVDGAHAAATIIMGLRGLASFEALMFGCLPQAVQAVDARPQKPMSSTERSGGDVHVDAASRVIGQYLDLHFFVTCTV